MSLGHAAAEFFDQLARSDPGRGELDPGIAHPAGYRERTQPLAPIAALAGEPLRPFLDDVAHPVERLDVVAEGRAAEQANLGGEGRPLPRQASLALDAFEHRRFFAANVGAGAPAQVNARLRRQSRRVDRKQPRRRLLQHQTPLASGRKPGAAEPAQPGMLEDPDDFLGFALPGEAGPEQAIPAIGTVSIEADKFRDYRVLLAHRNCGG